MRTTGALRVILNAHLVAGMKFELANDNCLRFTNVDGIYMIKVDFCLVDDFYLVPNALHNHQANPKDIEHLSQAIESRVREMTKRLKTEHEELPSDSVDDGDEQQQEREESAFDSI